jgi:hypothetical protein
LLFPEVLVMFRLEERSMLLGTTKFCMFYIPLWVGNLGSNFLFFSKMLEIKAGRISNVKRYRGCKHISVSKTSVSISEQTCTMD